MNLRCSECGLTESIDTRSWQCDCGGLFELQGASSYSPQLVQVVRDTLWRYQDALPIRDPAHIVTLGEGGTPLLQAEVFGLPVRYKLEFLAPTGSFKDRGASLLVSWLQQLGVKEVVEDSSGNAAASLAAYCARAGIKARIFVPADASPAKLAQIRIYGAELVTTAGPRENAAAAAHEAAASSYYASHNYHPLFVEGVKTIAYELYDQLDGRAPDHLVVPVGNGSLLVGAYLGFKELVSAGLVPRLPQFVAVQASACAPFFEAFRKGWNDVRSVSPGDTVAEGIRIAAPVRGRQVLTALRQSEGAVLVVDDWETLQAQQLLAHSGLYVEPTSATAIAALRKMDKMIGREAITIVVLTGTGLKHPEV